MILVSKKNIVFFTSLIILISSCSTIKYENFKITGNTMGTSYSIVIKPHYHCFFIYHEQKSNELITVVDDDTTRIYSDPELAVLNITKVKSQVDSILTNINNIFSTYIHTSEISRLNSSHFIKLSPEFSKVYRKAAEYYYLSNGIYDITISPLIELWGFNDYNPTKFPLDHDIKKTLEYVGFDKIDSGFQMDVLHKDLELSNLTVDSLKISKNKNIKIDLNSIAKGYAVDVLTDYLETYYWQFEFLIEIGGEVSSSDLNKDNSELEDWVVGIQHPYTNTLLTKVKLNNYSMATSGTYNNFFEKDGIEYSHIINPKSGYPIENNIVSTTVIARECIDADALATMLMLMDLKEGIEIINSIDNTECLIVKKNNNKDLTLHYSDSFLDFIID